MKIYCGNTEILFGTDGSKRMSSFESSARVLRDVLLGSKMPKCDDLGVFFLFNLLSSQVGDFHLP